MNLTAVLLLGLLIAALAPAATAKPGPGSPAERNAQVTKIQILGLNDFHGQLEPVPSSSSGGRIGATPAGGAEYLATHVRMLRMLNPNTLFVSAGDLIGATPLLSALFHDEPTIEAFNMMGLDYNGVGNHEFDEGVDELLRMQHGGCHPHDGCLDGDGFEGATFKMLAANVKYKATGQPIFPPYAIHQFDGVKVGIVGMTLEATPSIVTPAGISHVDFFDEADSVNALVPVLKRQGVETIIVLLHEGGSVTGGLNETTINQCNNPSGPLPPIVERMHDAIDVVVTGHTNWAVNCVIDGKIVTGAAATGRLITKIDLTISRATKDVIRSQTLVNNRIVTQTVPKAADMTALIAKYNVIAAPLANRVIGSISDGITRLANTAGESALGDVIADAQLLATTPTSLGGAVMAFMNPGGIRADLTFPSSPAGEGDGQVTYGEAFAVQPFGNSLVTMTLTGLQIDTLLEQQFDNPVVAQSRMLQISDGLTYTWDAMASTGNKVSNIRLNGTLLDPAASYRVTVNSFLADGGDNFFVLRDGTNRLGGDVDLDALEKYFIAEGVVDPGPQNRITRVG